LREHILLAKLFTALDRGGYYHLAQVVDPLYITLWQQGWKNGRTLGLNEPEALIWDHYLRALRIENLRLSKREDEFMWEGDPGGIYTPKDGYAQLSIKPLQQDTKWWWRNLWKQKCQAKGKILVWKILENKVPTWDILHRRQFHGPSWCSLCRAQGELVDHLFMHFPFTTSVWVESSKLNITIGH
jgi:hypothetical protein